MNLTFLPHPTALFQSLRCSYGRNRYWLKLLNVIYILLSYFAGIQNTEGEYMIQLPSWSRTIEAAGTTITYIHEDNRYADRIYIPGPIQYELNLMVCCSTCQVMQCNGISCCGTHNTVEYTVIQYKAASWSGIRGLGHSLLN